LQSEDPFEQRPFSADIRLEESDDHGRADGRVLSSGRRARRAPYYRQLGKGGGLNRGARTSRGAPERRHDVIRAKSPAQSRWDSSVATTWGATVRTSSRGPLVDDLEKKVD